MDYTLAVLFFLHTCKRECINWCKVVVLSYSNFTFSVLLLGDHFYKANASLALENQMISAMPDIKLVPISEDQEFIVFACDGIW